MNSTLLGTLASPLRKARSVNYTTNGYPTRVPTATKPTLADAGDATSQVAFENGGQSTGGRNGLFVLPYGLHASVDNKTMSLRVIGWRPTLVDDQNQSDKVVWIPVPLVEAACTLSGTQIGVAGRSIIATEGFADTITLTGTTANANVGEEMVTPVNDTIGHLVVDLKGAMLFEIIFTTGGSVTSANALWALL